MWTLKSIRRHSQKTRFVKEENVTETNTKDIERIKMGSNKICVRNDLRIKKIMFSEESSQAIFDTGNVEYIELIKFRTQCPSCLHYVFKGTIICSCGKLIRPDQGTLRKVKQAFEIPRAPYFRTSMLTSRGFNHGPNLWQEHHSEAKDALRGCSKMKRTYTSICDRWTNDQVYRESQLAHDWSDAFVRYLDTFQQSTYLTTQRRSREAGIRICFTSDLSMTIDRVHH